MDEILINSERIREWEKELAELEAKAARLKRILAHAQQLASIISEDEDQGEKLAKASRSVAFFLNQVRSTVESVAGMGLTDAARAFFDAHPDGWHSHKEIRAWLSSHGVEDEEFGQNAATYYNAVNRLAASGEIEKKGKLFKAKKKSD